MKEAKLRAATQEEAASFVRDRMGTDLITETMLDETRHICRTGRMLNIKVEECIGQVGDDLIMVKCKYCIGCDRAFIKVEK